MSDLEQTFHVTIAGTAPRIESSNTAPLPVLGSERDPFSRVLRVSGAVLIAISASTFMFQHWSQNSDVTRYWMLLGHTATVVLAAVLCSTGLQAARSARTLFGLVLATLPVHFTVLGALVYSRVGAVSADLPSAAVWAAPSLGAALITAAGALAVLVPSGWLALRVLTRSHARQLATVLALANASLLIPLRAPSMVGVILLALSVVLLVIDRRFGQAHELRTFEGRAVRALCFAPLGVMAGRALLYYDTTVIFGATLLLAGAFTWFSLCHRKGYSKGAVHMQRCAIMPVVIAASLIANELRVGQLETLCFAALVTALLVPMGERALGGRGFYVSVAGIVSCAALLLAAYVHPQPYEALLALIIGVFAMVSGALTQRLGLLLVAGAIVVLALMQELYLVVDFAALRHWGSLAVAGLVLILGAAVLEKHGQRLSHRFNAMRGELTGWDW